MLNILLARVRLNSGPEAESDRKQDPRTKDESLKCLTALLYKKGFTTTCLVKNDTHAYYAFTVIYGNFAPIQKSEAYSGKKFINKLNCDAAAINTFWHKQALCPVTIFL